MGSKKEIEKGSKKGLVFRDPSRGSIRDPVRGPHGFL